MVEEVNRRPEERVKNRDSSLGCSGSFICAVGKTGGFISESVRDTCRFIHQIQTQGRNPPFTQHCCTHTGLLQASRAFSKSSSSFRQCIGVIFFFLFCSDQSQREINRISFNILSSVIVQNAVSRINNPPFNTSERQSAVAVVSVIAWTHHPIAFYQMADEWHG